MYKNSLATTVCICSSDKPQSWVILCLHLCQTPPPTLTHTQICIHTLLLLISAAQPIHHTSSHKPPLFCPPPAPSSPLPSLSAVVSSAVHHSESSLTAALPRCTAAPTATSTKHTTAKTPWQGGCGCWQFHTESDTDPYTHMNTHIIIVCISCTSQGLQLNTFIH